MHTPNINVRTKTPHAQAISFFLGPVLSAWVNGRANAEEYLKMFNGYVLVLIVFVVVLFLVIYSRIAAFDLELFPRLRLRVRKKTDFHTKTKSQPSRKGTRSITPAKPGYPYSRYISTNVYIGLALLILIGLWYLVKVIF